MPGALFTDAVRRLVETARAAGVDENLIAHVETTILDGHTGCTGALLWVKANPDTADPSPGCCWGSVLDGPAGCTCWVPHYDQPQQPPTRPVTSVDHVTARQGMCGDCAYRPRSPERCDQWIAEELMGLPATGTPFWCHDGLRRPARWEHPDGRTIDGDTADWQPLKIGGIPYQADGTPALLCGGWAAIVARQHSEPRC